MLQMLRFLEHNREAEKIIRVSTMYVYSDVAFSKQMQLTRFIEMATRLCRQEDNALYEGRVSSLCLQANILGSPRTFNNCLLSLSDVEQFPSKVIPPNTILSSTPCRCLSSPCLIHYHVLAHLSSVMEFLGRDYRAHTSRQIAF